MQYDVSSPEEYLEVLENDWRKEKLMQLRQLIISTAEDIEEGIQYKMLSYSDDRGVFCHLNAQKNFVALYVGNAEKIDPGGSLLKGINFGKGCIRFKKSDNVEAPNIAAFVAKTIALWKDNADIGC